MPGHRATPAFGGGVPATLLGGLVAGTLGFAAIIFAHEGENKYVAVAFAGALILIAMPLIRNLRLFCLYMILLLAPLFLRLSFLRFPHMGGAGAMYIEVVDPFLLLLLYFQVRDRIRGYRRGYRFPAACALWSAMILLGVGSVIFMGTLRITAANEVVRMTKLLLLVLLLINEVVERRQFHHVVVALSLGVILQSTIALTQYLRGAQIGLGFLGEASDKEIKTLSDATLLTGDFVYRASGLLGHANLLAGYLALLLPMAVALFLAPVTRRLKVLLAIALLVGQPALVLTLSRAGWVDYAIAFVLVLVLGAWNPVSRRRYLLARVVIIAGAVAVALALSPQIIQRLYETDPSAVENRIKWLRTARAMILDNPVFGTGLNTYVFAQLPYGEERTPLQMHDRYGEYWPAVHNTWVLTWAEQGTIGFLLFVGLHFSVIAVAVRNLRIRDPILHALSVGLLAGFIAIMVDGFASFFVRQEPTARMFWIALGLILAIGYWRRTNENRDPVPAESFAAPKPLQADRSTVTNGRWLPARESVLR